MTQTLSLSLSLTHTHTYSVVDGLFEDSFVCPFACISAPGGRGILQCVSLDMDQEPIGKGEGLNRQTRNHQDVELGASKGARREAQKQRQKAYGEANGCPNFRVMDIHKHAVHDQLPCQLENFEPPVVDLKRCVKIVTACD